jgi:hypothetical protein
MQDLGYELPRIPIPRTPVNKGERRDRSSPSNLYLYQGLLVPQPEYTLLVTRDKPLKERMAAP